ncbi:MAG: T9SS type A sorting domain-containing protein [Bacteroidetes bacterium]|nr:T9SS type A sorting domain-containing protein [Bacteroidota bacterium]
MKKSYSLKFFTVLLMLALTNTNSFATFTNPAGFDLSTGNYSFNNWPSNSTAGTYPPNMMFHWVNVGDATMANYTGDSYADYACAYSNPPITSGPRIFGYGTSGFSFLNTGSAQSNACATGQGGFCGDAELALITTGRSAIQVSWQSNTVTVNPRVYGLRLQYRVGAAGNYTDVPGPIEYISGNGVQNIGPVTLPAACENKPLVDLRWVYYYISGSGARSEISMTNISVTSSPGYFTIANPVNLTALNTNQPLPSPAGTFQLSGTDLSAANTTVQFSPATTNFELSTDNTNFFSSLTLPNSNGGLTGQPVTIYVRQSATAPLGTNSATVQVSATGATSSTVGVSGTVGPPVPVITPSTTSLTGFSAIVGNPSASQNFYVNGNNLVANVTATAPSGYEISLNNITWFSSLTLTQSGGTLVGQPVYIYARITAAAPLGPTNGTLTLTSTNATTQNISLTGNVIVPPPVITTTALNPGGPFSAVFGNASSAQTFTVSGANLVADVTITPPTGYELSLNNISYTPTLTITQSGGTLPGQPITVYARLAATAALGAHNGNIALTSTNATTQNIAVTGTVVIPTVTTTGTINLFSSMSGYPSAPQTLILNGSNLQGDVTVTAPAGFEISTDNITYNNSILLLQVGGSLVGQPITLYTRIKASAAGWVSGNLVFTSALMPTMNILVRGNANLPFTNGDIAVTRVGDSLSTLVNTGNVVFIDEFTPAGVKVQSIILPSAAAYPANNLVLSGVATSEGHLSRSLNSQYLIVAGYDTTATNTMATSLSNTSAATLNRSAALIRYDGAVNVATALSDATGNARGAYTTDGNNLWIGCSSSGIRYCTVGSGTSTQITTTPTNIRDIGFAEYDGGGIGQLFMSSSSGATRLAQVGTGLPTTGPQTVTNINGPILTSPYQFFYADLDPATPGADVLWVADDGIGLVRFSLVGTTWQQDGVIGAPSDVYRGVTGTVNSATGIMTIYAVRRFDGTATGNGGDVVSFTDNMGHAPATFTAPTLNTVVAAGTNNKISYRGIALVPYNPTCVGGVVNWTGNASANTKLAANWCSLTTPTTSNDVVYDATGTTNQPRVDSAGNDAHNLSVKPGVVLNFASGSSYNLTGSISNGGTFNSALGTLSFTGASAQGTPALHVARLITNCSSVNPAGNVQVDTMMTMTAGDIQLGADTLTLGTSTSLLGTLSHTSGRIYGYMKRWFNGTNGSDSTGLFPFGFGGNDRFITVGYTTAPSTPGSLIGHYWSNDLRPYLTINNNVPLWINNVAPCTGMIGVSHIDTNMWKLVPADGFANQHNPATDGLYDVTLAAENLNNYTVVCDITALKSDNDTNFFEDGAHVASTLVGSTVIAKRTGASGWSDWTFGGNNNNPLLIKLLNFDGRKLNNIQSQLQWRANADGGETFVLERSTNGKEFSLINTQVAKAGTNNYSYVDNSPAIGGNYYRLAIKDANGQTVYSNVVTITMNGNGLQLVSIAPNVVTGNATVHITNDNAETATMRVIDAMGNTVMTQPLQLNAGSTFFTLNAAGLRTGTYMLQIIANGAMVQQRFIKQ